LVTPHLIYFRAVKNTGSPRASQVQNMFMKTNVLAHLKRCKEAEKSPLFLLLS